MERVIGWLLFVLREWRAIMVLCVSKGEVVPSALCHDGSCA